MATSLANSMLRPNYAGVEVYAAVQKGGGIPQCKGGGGGGVRGGVGGMLKCRGYPPMHYKAFLRRREQEWREDPTNQVLKYARNRVRWASIRPPRDA